MTHQPIDNGLFLRQVRENPQFARKVAQEREATDASIAAKKTERRISLVVLGVIAVVAAAGAVALFATSALPFYGEAVFGAASVGAMLGMVVVVLRARRNISQQEGEFSRKVITNEEIFDVLWDSYFHTLYSDHHIQDVVNMMKGHQFFEFVQVAIEKSSSQGSHPAAMSLCRVILNHSEIQGFIDWLDTEALDLELHEKFYTYANRLQSCESKQILSSSAYLRYLPNELKSSLLPYEEYLALVQPAQGRCTLDVLEGNMLDLPVEAVVNAAQVSLAHGGGVCGAVHSAAGPKLAQACDLHKQKMGITQIDVGEAVLTKAFGVMEQNPHVRFVIHVVGPTGDRVNKEQLLVNTYVNALKEAQKMGVRSIAFPAISTGIHGYDFNEAQRVAIRAIKGYLEEHSNSFDKIVLAYCTPNKPDEAADQVQAVKGLVGNS